MGKKNQEFCFRLKMCINIQEHSCRKIELEFRRETSYRNIQNNEGYVTR